MSIVVSEVHAASIIALMMEASRASETSVDIQVRTRQYIPEDSELHTRRRENLKSHIVRRASAVTRKRNDTIGVTFPKNDHKLGINNFVASNKTYKQRKHI
jgi:hypothetical protein